MAVAAVVYPPGGRGESQAARRFTLVVGSNYGGPGRVRLQYAVSDARAFMKVLSRMGGVHPSDATLLVEPDHKAFARGLEDLRREVLRAKSAARRVEVIFYYSGHSDEEGLLLGREKFPYRELRESIEKMPADVRIAVLDSCSSGAFTRMKGGTMQAPFMVDSSQNMRGYAFLTSSSSDEVSQESDRIRGSFFTHYLISGLMGAADMNGDRRITLNESYQYAYHETLARTEKTYGGPQHPNYHIQMSGTGDVVITDTRKGAAGLIIHPSIRGRLSIRDDRNNLVAELNKQPGKEINLALEGGEYVVLNEKEGKLYQSRLIISGRGEKRLDPASFTAAGMDAAVLRKGDPSYRKVPFSFSLVPLKSGEGKTVHRWAFSLFGDYCARLEGLSLGLGLGLTDEDARWVMMNLIANYVGGDMKGAQMAYIMNYVRGDARYLQLSAVFNITRGSMGGTQLAAVFNYTGKEYRGVQASSVFNYAGESFTGLQMSVVNISGPLKGLQLGIVDVAGEVRGSQIGIINVAGDLKGTQVGLVNAAGDVGRGHFQLGLVNVADEMNGVPLGLVNLSRNGGVDLVAWGSNLTAANAGVRFRSGSVYTMFSAGWMNLEGDEALDASQSWAFHAGYRIRGKILSMIDPEIVYIDVDAGFMHIDNGELFSDKVDKDRFALQARITAGVLVLHHITFFAGGGVSYLFDVDGDAADGSYKPLVLAGVGLQF